MGTQPSTLFTLVTDSNQIRWWLSYFWSGVSLFGAAAAAAKSLQSCPTLCDPIDGSSPGSPIPGILQARTLEWVATSFSNAWQWKVKVKLLSHVQLLAALWTAAHQAPLSMGFSRQQYWSGVPLPSPNQDLQYHRELLLGCSDWSTRVYSPDMSVASASIVSWWFFMLSEI